MGTRGNTGSSECVDIDINSGNSSGLSAVATIGISFGAVLIVLVLAFVGYRFYLSSNSKTPLAAAAEGAPVAGAGAGTTDTVRAARGGSHYHHREPDAAAAAAEEEGCCTSPAHRDGRLDRRVRGETFSSEPGLKYSYRGAVEV